MDSKKNPGDSGVGPSKKRAKLDSFVGQLPKEEEVDSDEFDEIDYGEDDDGTEQVQQAHSKEVKNLAEKFEKKVENEVYNSKEDDDEISSHSGFLDDDEDEEEQKERRDIGENEEQINCEQEVSNQDDSEDKSEQKPTADRCKFWPSCNAGSKCAYYHPTKPCKTFPNCRFGNKCLYMHPPCKFNPNCAKPNCPFAHPIAQSQARRPTPGYFRPVLQPPVTAWCKYGSNCTNAMCKFSHQRQEPCRFGANCLLETCPFSHPQNSERKKSNAFKWTAQS